MQIVKPGPGQESVWDYPRPPRVEPVTVRITIELDGRLIADTAIADTTIAGTTASVRVLETSHPPVYYLPRSAFVDGILQPAPGQSFCEFKGLASYLSVGSEDRAAWFYPNPSHGYEILTDLVAVYPGRMQRCMVGNDVVTPQEGDFYGGWITPAIVGPFKGAPGTLGW